MANPHPQHTHAGPYDRGGSGGITLQSMAAWAFLFAGLVVASDFPGLGDLAAAFALLILIATLLGFGPAAFDNISKLVTEGS